MSSTPAQLTFVYHLEAVIWSDASDGTRMNAAAANDLVAKASVDQRRRALANLNAKICEVYDFEPAADVIIEHLTDITPM